jgi:hypothetical protein
MLMTALTFGQASLSGSAEAQEKLQRQLSEMREAQREARARNREPGELAGAVRPDQYKVGDWGKPNSGWKVLTVVGSNEVLVSCEPDHYGEIRYPAFLIRGEDTSKLATGQVFGLRSPVVITGTYSYTGGVGTKQTVLVMDTDPQLLAAKRERAAIDTATARKAAINALTRTWTITERNKEPQVFEARYLNYTGKRVYLERTSDGKHVDYHWFSLSNEDQKWVRAQLTESQQMSKKQRRLPASGVARSVQGQPQKPDGKPVTGTGDPIAAVKEEIQRIKKAMADDEERLCNAPSAEDRRRLENWLNTYKERLAAQEKKLAELEKN